MADGVITPERIGRERVRGERTDCCGCGVDGVAWACAIGHIVVDIQGFLLYSGVVTVVLMKSIGGRYYQASLRRGYGRRRWNRSMVSVSLWKS